MNQICKKGNLLLLYHLSTIFLPEVLKVTDINGRVIKTLMNCNHESGKHTKSFDASGLADGICFITFQMNKQSINKN